MGKLWWDKDFEFSNSKVRLKFAINNNDDNNFDRVSINHSIAFSLYESNNMSYQNLFNESNEDLNLITTFHLEVGLLLNDLKETYTDKIISLLDGNNVSIGSLKVSHRIEPVHNRYQHHPDSSSHDIIPEKDNTHQESESEHEIQSSPSRTSNYSDYNNQADSLLSSDIFKFLLRVEELREITLPEPASNYELSIYCTGNLGCLDNTVKCCHTTIIIIF